MKLEFWFLIIWNKKNLLTGCRFCRNMCLHIIILNVYIYISCIWYTYIYMYIFTYLSIPFPEFTSRMAPPNPLWVLHSFHHHVQPWTSNKLGKKNVAFKIAWGKVIPTWRCNWDANVEEVSFSGGYDSRYDDMILLWAIILSIVVRWWIL